MPKTTSEEVFETYLGARNYGRMPFGEHSRERCELRVSGLDDQRGHERRAEDLPEEISAAIAHGAATEGSRARHGGFIVPAMRPTATTSTVLLPRHPTRPDFER